MPEINEIDRQAAEWAAKASDENLSSALTAARDAWLAADTRHLGAYVRARAAMSYVETRAASHAAPITFRQPTMRRRMILVGGIAAGLAAVIAIPSVLLHSSHWEAEYATAVGQSKTTSLPDGSQLTLNTNSRITIHFSHNTRELHLLAGEALFDVAKDAKRPFVVTANGTQVRAVGTSFVVSSLPERPLKVIVREGVVRLAVQGVSSSLAVPAGYEAEVSPGFTPKLSQLSATDLTRELAWRDGYIFLRHATLAAAAVEFSRYSRTPIIVDDPALAALTVTGLYLSSDPAGFALATARSLKLRADIEPNGVHIRRAP